MNMFRNDKLRKVYPYYDESNNYNTNAKSYLDYLAKSNKLYEILAARIWEYEETLDLTLEEINDKLTRYIQQNEYMLTDMLTKWDERIENLDDEVSHIFVTWLNDGTLEQIINHDILGNKADKTFVDSEIQRLNQKDEHLTTQMVQSIQQNRNYIDNQLKTMNGLELKGAYGTLQDLVSAYPNGTQGIFIVQENGHWYYWNGSWSDGGLYQATPWDDFMTENNEEWVI